MEPDGGTATAVRYSPARELHRHELVSLERKRELEPNSAECVTVQPGTGPIPELGNHLLHGKRRKPELSGNASGSYSQERPWPVLPGGLYLGSRHQRRSRRCSGRIRR